MTARCATPEGIALVDAALARPGGPAQRRMENEVCPPCDVWEECLRFALDHGEHGPWGGTSERERRKYVRRPYHFNITTRRAHRRALKPAGDRKPPCPAVNVVLLRELGLNAGDVKQWALDTGYATKVPRATPSVDMIQAYADAHRVAV
jgi:hypothetical protein